MRKVYGKMLKYTALNKKGEYDLEKQKEIAGKYKLIEQVKKELKKELDKVIDTSVEFS